MNITDDQIHAYLIHTGWTERHMGLVGLWSRDGVCTCSEPLADLEDAMNLLCAAEKRAEAEVLRDIARAMPMMRSRTDGGLDG